MGDNSAARLVAALDRRGATLASAESVTGGLFGATMTDIPGAGDVYRGGVISYMDGVKKDLLGIDGGLIEAEGAVCEQVAARMALAAREKLDADYGVSFSGFAGPDAPDGKPVGLVYIGVATPTGVEVREYRFAGSRADIRAACVREALRWLETVVS